MKNRHLGSHFSGDPRGPFCIYCGQNYKINYTSSSADEIGLTILESDLDGKYQVYTRWRKVIIALFFMGVAVDHLSNLNGMGYFRPPGIGYRSLLSQSYSIYYPAFLTGTLFFALSSQFTKGIFQSIFKTRWLFYNSLVSTLVSIVAGFCLSLWYTGVWQGIRDNVRIVRAASAEVINAAWGRSLVAIWVYVAGVLIFFTLTEILTYWFFSEVDKANQQFLKMRERKAPNEFKSGWG